MCKLFVLTVRRQKLHKQLEIMAWKVCYDDLHFVKRIVKNVSSMVID